MEWRWAGPSLATHDDVAEAIVTSASSAIRHARRARAPGVFPGVASGQAGRACTADRATRTTVAAEQRGDPSECDMKLRRYR
jgi:hypothetical protein